MEAEITKREKDYIIFNISGFFRHYKVDQRIKKVSFDINNLQLMNQEVKHLQHEINKYKVIINNIKNVNDANNQNKSRLVTKKRNRVITKSIDTIKKRVNEKKDNSKNKGLNYELNISGIESRPKTPDVSKIFDKYKKKRNNTNIINSNYNNRIQNKSFMQHQRYRTKVFNSNLNNKSCMSTSNNKKKSRDNSIDNKKNNNIKNLNIEKSPNKLIKQSKIYSKPTHKDKSPTQKLVPKSSTNNTKILNKSKIIPSKNFYMGRNNILNQRFHSIDIIKKQTKNEGGTININKKVNKKIFKLGAPVRKNMKTPSPPHFRKDSKILIDHDTVVRNRNKKIINIRNKNNDIIQKHKKLKSFQIKAKKDISKEDEKKLDEQILPKNEKDSDLNNSKNLLDISQKILQNLEFLDNIEDINTFEIKNHDNLFMSNYMESSMG